VWIGDPGKPLLRFLFAEDANLAGDQETQRIDHPGYPGGIADDRDPLEPGRVYIQGIPAGSRVAGPDFVIKPHFTVTPHRGVHRRTQYVVAFLARDASTRDDANDIARKVINQLDHRLSPYPIRRD
jgi:hypothetical protein